MNRRVLSGLVLLLAFLARSGPAADVVFTYDDAGRLIAADHGGGGLVAYSYDASGNLLAIRHLPASPAVATSGLSVAATIPGPSPSTFVPFVLRLTVTNAGPSAARGTVISQSLPPGVTLRHAASTQGFVASLGNPVRVDLGTLMPGRAAVIELTLVASAPGAPAFATTVSSPTQPGPGSVAANVSPVIGPSVDLVLAGSAGPDPLTLGTPLIHSFVVSNATAVAASGVTLVHTHHPDATFVSVTASQGTTAQVAGQVTANLGALAAGAVATVTIRVAPIVAGTYTNHTAVAATEPDPRPADNTADLATPVVAPTLMVTHAGDDGPGSLRQALVAANANPDRDVIAFQIPSAPDVPTLAPLSALPPLVHPVVIDGFTQAEGWVEIQGSDVHPLLRVQGGNSVVRGLVLNRALVFGLVLEQGGNNVVEGCRIGTGPAGLTALPNGGAGISIADGSGGNRIGGPAAWQRNLVGTNDGAGISISGSQGNRIEGNFIGLGADGTTRLGNNGPGILLDDTTADVIAGNVIAGNAAEGVSVSFRAFDTRLLGNRIGTDAGGQLARPNLGDGIGIGLSAVGVAVGGAGPGEGNLVSGNAGDGIDNSSPGVRIAGNLIGTDLGGAARVPNGGHGVRLQFAPGAVVGGALPGEGNLLSGNVNHGLFAAAPAHRNCILGNIVGLDAAGALVLSNGSSGLGLSGSLSNLVGGPTPGAGNLISGNLRHGLELSLGSQFNRVLGNTIGTDRAGTLARSNALHGVTLAGTSQFNDLGGLDPGEGNLISGNGLDGISLTGSASDNRILGNFLGTDRAGSAPVGNRIGISTFQTARGIRIDRNLISGNRGLGVQLTHASGAGATLVDNFVGTDARGLAPVPNASDGVAAFNSPNHVIGPGNVLSGNGRHGLSLSLAGSTNSRVVGNVVGLAADLRSPLGNATNGIAVFDVPDGRIGGPDPDDANVVGANGVHGIQVIADPARPGGTVRHAILGNLVFGNGGRPLELGGPAHGVGDGANANDAGDADVGPNQFQNHPVLVAASSALVNATLDAAPATTYRIEFFAAPPGPVLDSVPRLLGHLDVLTDPAGHAEPSLAVADLPPGSRVVATATDPDGNTSEFSPEFIVVAGADTDLDGIPDDVEAARGTDPNNRANPALPPVAHPDTVERAPHRSIKIPIATLLANDADPNGTLPVLAGVAPSSAQGAVLAVEGGFVHYHAVSGSQADDVFVYFISDGALTGSGFVTVQVRTPESATFNLAIAVDGPNLLLHLAGIPGRAYRFQSAPSLDPPVAWSDVGPEVTADAAGRAVLSVTAEAPIFFRAVEPLTPAP